MKKTLVSALTTALVVGAASTTFAASNPFTDVPADHWAYDAVSQLAADGVIEGYGDSTFKGNRNITRYEMAQMVAKAMAKNTSGVDKALVDKLAAEFAEELNNLGVRVSNLERNADKVKWNGKAEYTYTSGHTEVYGRKDKANDYNLLFRLEPSAEVNNHWHVNARLDAETKLHRDAAVDGDRDGTRDDNVKMKRVWAQGDYDKFQVKLGKFASLNDDSFADTDFSGAEVRFGKEVKGILGAGRLSKLAGNNLRDAANYQYVGVEANKGKAFGGLYWHHVNTDDLKLVSGAGTSKAYANSKTDEGNIIGVKAGYTFSKNVALNGWYTNNHDADTQDQAASAEVDYKGAQQENKGTWGAWLAYRHLGRAAMVKSTYDVIDTGYKGWEIGGNYTLLKNVVATLRYGNEKHISDSQIKAQNFFGRVEFFF